MRKTSWTQDPHGKEKETTMNGLIKQTKLDGVNTVASFAIALFSVAAVIYVMATAITGGGVA
jgi:hypothetical protein